LPSTPGRADRGRLGLWVLLLSLTRMVCLICLDDGSGDDKCQSGEGGKAKEKVSKTKTKWYRFKTANRPNCCRDTSFLVCGECLENWREQVEDKNEAAKCPACKKTVKTTRKTKFVSLFEEVAEDEMKKRKAEGKESEAAEKRRRTGEQSDGKELRAQLEAEQKKADEERRAKQEKEAEENEKRLREMLEEEERKAQEERKKREEEEKEASLALIRQIQEEDRQAALVEEEMEKERLEKDRIAALELQEQLRGEASSTGRERSERTRHEPETASAE